MNSQIDFFAKIKIFSKQRGSCHFKANEFRNMMNLLIIGEIVF